MKDLTCKVICKISFGDKIDGLKCNFRNLNGQIDVLDFDDFIAKSIGQSFISFFHIPLDLFSAGLTIKYDIGKERQRVNANERETIKNIRFLIEDRITNHYVPKRKDILSYYVEHKDEMTIEQMIDNLGFFLFAGNDTSSHTLATIFHRINENTQVKVKIMAEIEEKVTKGREFNIRKLTDIIDKDVLNDLPYLTAVIKES